MHRMQLNDTFGCIHSATNWLAYCTAITAPEADVCVTATQTLYLSIAIAGDSTIAYTYSCIPELAACHLIHICVAHSFLLHL